ncbi:MAG: hypothetical protein ACAH17_00815 [Candidatus Paceibacterota bacterium]
MSQTNSKEPSEAELKELHDMITSGFRGIFEQFDKLSKNDFDQVRSEFQGVIGRLDGLIEKGAKVDRAMDRSELLTISSMRGLPQTPWRPTRHYERTSSSLYGWGR